jgi:hypothetical protein
VKNGETWKIGEFVFAEIWRKINAFWADPSGLFSSSYILGIEMAQNQE